MMVHPLRRYRDTIGITQLELANQLGVTNVTVSRWETGKRVPRPRVVTEISEKTGISRAELLGFEPQGAAS